MKSKLIFCLAACSLLVVFLNSCLENPRVADDAANSGILAIFDSTRRGQTSAELVAVLQGETNEEIIGIWTDDYNYDGEPEAYAMTAKTVPSKDNAHTEGLSLWFIKRNEARSVAVGDLDVKPTFFDFTDKKLCCINSYSDGKATSEVFFVAGKYAHSYGNFGARLIQDDSDASLFYLLKTETDAVLNGATGIYSGDTEKPYYLYFDGNFFREYGGSFMREDQLRAVAGADTVLSAISEGGYHIEEIFRRDNGIININISKTATVDGVSVTSYDNVTLYTKAGIVSIVPRGVDIGQDVENSQKTAGEIIAERFQNPERFSYGGKYSACALERIAVFPKQEKITE